jgi:dienelactone hydrolase
MGNSMNKTLVLICGVCLVMAVPARGDVPQTARELWADFPAMDKATPLEAEVHKKWEQQGIVVELVRFTVAVIDGQKLKLAGFFAYPKDANNLPGLVQCHGGGQKASVGGPVSWAQNGYATFCPNNGAQSWGEEGKGLPNTDWGRFNPAVRNPDKRDGPGRLAPGEGTVDKVVSPRNEAMYLRMLGMRRALTFLQNRPEVNPDKLGFRGHSTGGVMAVRTATDPRLKAVVPSVGGCGFWWEEYPYIVNNLRGSAGMDDPQKKLFLDTVSCDAYWKTMRVPILFLASTNDFNSPTDNVVRALSHVPHDNKRLVMATHYNHSFSPAASIADEMWFEHHLKGTFVFPQSPKLELVRDYKDSLVRVRATPDPTSKLTVNAVDIFYTYGRQPQVRYWADAMAKKRVHGWEAVCPTFFDDEPLSIHANVTYTVEHTLGNPQHKDQKELLVTSNYIMLTPEQLKEMGVTPTQKISRVIDDFSRGLQDWTGKLSSPRGWSLETRKIVDPRWIGPKGAELVCDVLSPAPGATLGVMVTRRFNGQSNGEYRYYGFVKMTKKGWNEIRVKPDMLENVYGKKLDDWHKVMKLQFIDGQTLARDKQKRIPRAGNKRPAGSAGVPTDVSSWSSKYYHSTDPTFADDNVQDKTGKTIPLRNLRWEGGAYVKRPKHWKKG